MKTLQSALALILAGLLLAGCGPLPIQVDSLPLSSPAASPAPTPAVIIQSPTAALPSPPPSPTPAPIATTIPSNHLKPGIPLKINQISMEDIYNGWAMGYVESDSAQHVLLTADAGKTWQDRTPLEANLKTQSPAFGTAAYFASVSQAWVAYAGPDAQSPLYVWHTQDSGLTWEKSQPLALADLNMEMQLPSDLGFLDDQNGWLMVHLGVGMSHDYFAAFKTADGGRTWRRVVDPNTPAPLQGCYKTGLVFSDPANAWLSGSCPGLMPQLFFYHAAFSSNGGVNWAPVTLPDPAGKPAGYLNQNGPSGCGVTALHRSRLAGQSLAAVVQCFNFDNNSSQAWDYTSPNGGATWAQSPLPLPYQKISALNMNEMFLVGSLQADSNAPGAVYHTTNAGKTWDRLTATAWQGTPNFVDAQTGWVIATHGEAVALVYTSDGGRTWTELKPVIGS